MWSLRSNFTFGNACVFSILAFIQNFKISNKLKISKKTFKNKSDLWGHTLFYVFYFFLWDAEEDNLPTCMEVTPTYFLSCPKIKSLPSTFSLVPVPGYTLDR